MEFALALPIFLALTLAVIEFGWAIYASTTVNDAAHAGARRGIVLGRRTDSQPGHWFVTVGNTDGTYEGPLTCNPETIVGTVACHIGLLQSSRITVTLSTPDEVPATQNVIAGNEVVVTVRYEYRPIVGLFLSLPSVLTMTGVATSFTT